MAKSFKLFSDVRRFTISMFKFAFLEPLRFLIIFPIVLFVRIIRPIYLVRWQCCFSGRVGHLAANMELYCCEQDAGINCPSQPHFDIFFWDTVVANRQLKKMWERVLHIWPRWLMEPISRINRIIPGGVIHEIGYNTQHDRDVHNLMDKLPVHLWFTQQEEMQGLLGMQKLGITGPFVCLQVRDSAYLSS